MPEQVINVRGLVDRFYKNLHVTGDAGNSEIQVATLTLGHFLGACGFFVPKGRTTLRPMQSNTSRMSVPICQHHVKMQTKSRQKWTHIFEE
jgi:hypothetical protein